MVKNSCAGLFHTQNGLSSVSLLPEQKALPDEGLMLKMSTFTVMFYFGWTQTYQSSNNPRDLIN